MGVRKTQNPPSCQAFPNLLEGHSEGSIHSRGMEPLPEEFIQGPLRKFPMSQLEKTLAERSLKGAAPLILFVSLALAGCQPPAPTQPVARVAGEPILVGDLIQAYRREGAKFGTEVFKDRKRLLQVKESLLEDLIQKKILSKEAAKEDLTVPDEELEQEIRHSKSRYTEKDFQEMLKSKGIDYAVWREVKRNHLLANRLLQEKVFAKIQISEEGLKEYYQAHQEEFTQPESVRVRQILTDTREKAEDILAKLKKDENFPRMARAYSLAPDRKQGGDLGFITKGSFPKDFDVCFDLKVGELSPIVSSLYGFHLFKVVEKRPEQKLPFEEVRGQIEEWLKEKAREEAFQGYYEELKKRSPVEIDQKVLKAVVLPAP